MQESNRSISMKHDFDAIKVSREKSLCGNHVMGVWNAAVSPFHWYTRQCQKSDKPKFMHAMRKGDGDCGAKMFLLVSRALSCPSC
mmetsp:Transcript_16832/g.26284  ORF Transcript_16832/g.26284 Transcript_16832/m.26284 type:complete len:85 (-) Transcript_16832:1202-1456(-)